ncbi:MAG: alpha/beta hydrolase [Clostridiales bacterium]|nr:alpha/beta hydrolase [Clostridiales bacterium]
MKTIKLEGYDDFELVGYLWDKVEKPTGVLQIIHGMQEHALRYNSLARYLNKQGIIVFASDLRGHGQTALLHNLPFGYSDGDIFMEIVKDQIKITEYLYEKFNLPISILGHSFGSFITQRYMIENGFKVQNVILSGSTYTNGFQYKAGYILAQIQKAFGLKKKTAKMIENMSIRSYGKKFEDGNWLTRNTKIWEEYKADELCGKPFPVNFYHSFFKNARHNYKNLNNIPYYLPILIISGTNDPVSGEKGIIKLFYQYAKARKKLFLKSYLDARHEVINETNKEEVYEDIANFILNNKIDSLAIRYENL